MFRSILTNALRPHRVTGVARTFIGCTTKSLQLPKLTVSKFAQGAKVNARSSESLSFVKHTAVAERYFSTVPEGESRYMSSLHKTNETESDHQQKREMVKYPNGFVYEGEMACGLPHGQGKLTLRDGKVFEGEFVNGVLQGQPRTLISPLYRYEGDVLNEEPHGRGKQTFQNGVVREGEFCESAMIGQGKITYPNGKVEVGEFKNNMLNGFVVIYYPDGSRAEATFVNHCCDGVAKYFHPNGEICETYHVRGERQKPEKITRPDGSAMKGEYLTAISYLGFHTRKIIHRHGPFKFTHPSGLVEEGEMQYGQRVGRWKYTHPNGATTTEDIHLTIAQYAKMALARYEIFMGTTRYRGIQTGAAVAVVYSVLCELPRSVFFAG